MAARNTNLAYSLSQYEEREERTNARENTRQNIKSHKAAKPQTAVHPVFMVMLLIATGALISLCITSKADIASVHAAIVDQEAVVRSLEQENVSMMTRLEQKSSQKVVEDYAENVLGMQKLDNAQVEYVSLESGNKAEISDSSDNIFTKIKNGFNSFLEYLKG